jgi:hypothetical protein
MADVCNEFKLRTQKCGNNLSLQITNMSKYKFTKKSFLYYRPSYLLSWLTFKNLYE